MSRVAAPCGSASVSSSISASTCALRSETATRTWPWPMSTPATPPGRRASATSSGGRPLPPLYGVPRSSVSTTSPASSSSVTRLETVVRDRPGAAGEVGPALGSAGAEQTGDGAQVRGAQLREGVAGHGRQPRPIHPEVGLIPAGERGFPH